MPIPVYLGLHALLYKFVSLSERLYCKTVDAKLFILFPDGNMENDKSVASTRGAKVGWGGGGVGGSQPSPVNFEVGF